VSAEQPRPSPADLDFCYLTTTGRVTGRPHRIEIWFGLDGSTVYLLAGGGEQADWVRNLVHDPSVTLELAGRPVPARARVVADPGEQARARELLYQKYRRRYAGSLERWRDAALPVAVDLPEQP
jgi:deazaflavin-dependent oxidoreductase (nitroreductase family)